MQTQITSFNPVFQFESNEVRIVIKSGEPWFVATDVCKALDLVQTHRAIAALDDDEKGRHSMTTLGGKQEMSIINESGLYALILRSRKPEARKFAKWVTSEVLPSIRKTGSCAVKTRKRAVEKKPRFTKEEMANMAYLWYYANLMADYMWRIYPAIQFDLDIDYKGAFWSLPVESERTSEAVREMLHAELKNYTGRLDEVNNRVFANIKRKREPKKLDGKMAQIALV